MKICPKCGSDSIAGPKYECQMYGREVLIYRCITCGYEMETPCKDKS